MDTFHTETAIRRSLVLHHVAEDLRPALSRTVAGELLFGPDLGEVIKRAKVVESAVSQLRAKKETRAPKNGPTAPLAVRQLHRRAAHPGVGGSHTGHLRVQLRESRRRTVTSSREPKSRLGALRPSTIRRRDAKQNGKSPSRETHRLFASLEENYFGPGHSFVGERL